MTVGELVEALKVFDPDKLVMYAVDGTMAEAMNVTEDYDGVFI